MMGASVGASIGAGASAVGYFAITAFEIAIAFIQAYIFTMLSAVFIGASVSHEH
jgi:F-type H+-transporting ATPase subunit a